MIPILAEVIEQNGLCIWRTTDNRIGTGFELLSCDLETENSEEYYRKLVGFLRSIDPTLLSRIKMSCEHSNERIGDCSRSSSFSEIGFTKRSVILSVEVTGEPLIISQLKNIFTNANFNQDLSAIIKANELVQQSGLKTKPLTEDQIRKHFIDPYESWVKGEASITNGKERIGIIRLIKPSSEDISEQTLSVCSMKIPKPFEVYVSFKKLDQRKMRLDLERRLKQTTTTTSNPAEAELKNSTIEAIRSSLKSGTQFLEYEFLVILKRNSEDLLSRDSGQTLSALRNFGDFQIETFGTAPSFLSTLPGNSQHVTLKELDEVLPLMLPVWLQGEREEVTSNIRSLPLLRKDASAFSFDLFDSKFSVFNSVIVGTSGKGKSVLTGLLTQSLLNDPNVQIIKIDVGGSHSKECELFDGQEYVLQLNHSSGINPFLVTEMSEVSDSEKIGIISRFLSVLILEQGEIQFSKDLRSQIEENVKEYLTKAQNPSLQEFYDLQTNFPRRNLLKRWVKGSLYESAFAEEAEAQSARSWTSNTRLRYYNFSQVFQASDPEFAQAGIAAVLAQFNIESLKQNGRRIVLICDETPFFIKSCFEFFKFSTANVRKYGHAVILITQLSSDLIVGGDTGIIENSPQRFLFSVDGEVSEYQARFNLTSKQVESIKSLKAVPREFSEVFLQTGEIGRILTIKITGLEYWTLTSSQQDKIKLHKLQTAVPELSLKEAIQCLSAV